LISNHKLFYEVTIMFLFFTPYTFFFIFFYFLFLLFMFSCSNFVVFWVFIEFMMLIFMGISYTLFLNNFSSLMLYFLLQTISSFSILLFYLYPIPLMFSLFLTMKLSMFPFHFWFLNICYRFPNFVLYLASSFHKIPIFFILLLFLPPLRITFIIVSTILTVLISGFMILRSIDFRGILVSSSVGNNSWFLIRSILDIFSFCLFFLTYSFFLYLVFSELSVFTKPIVNAPSKPIYNLFYYITFIRGLPPFPVFFTKMFILFSLFIKFGLTIYLGLFIFSSCLILVGYIYSMAKYFTHIFSSQSLYLL
jgi:hypothetical protein